MSRLTTLASGQTVPSAIANYRSMKMTGLTTAYTTLSTVSGVQPDGDKVWLYSFYSERVAAEVTIAGAVTFSIWVVASTDTVNAKVRVKLYKVSGTNSGGVNTFICQQDSDVALSTGVTKYTFTAVTPATAITLGVGERLRMRLYLTPLGGGFGAGTTTLRFGEDTDNTSGNTWVDVTETLTVVPDDTTLFLRRTTAAGISTYYDMLEARGGSAATTGVVNSAASGTEIAWTRTAGGTALGWISPRLRHPGWNCLSAAIFPNDQFWAKESNLSANCALRYKVFRRDPLGVETLVFTRSWGFEFTTASIVYNAAATVAHTPTMFLEDDRIVCRAYIIPFGTMGGSQTCTLTYDHNVANADGDCFLTLLEVPLLKAEGDLPKASIPDGMSMGGVGN